MNLKNLSFHRVAAIFMLITAIGLVSCNEQNTKSDSPVEEPTRIPDTKTKLVYQPFNLHLAVEELRFLLSSNENAEWIALNSAPARAILQLKKPCQVDCEEVDIECLKKHVECTATMAMLTSGGGDDDDDDDGDGAEPLPIASDTSIVAFASATEVMVYSDDPEATSFELIGKDGKAFGSGSASSKSFRYDKLKKHVIFKIVVENEELKGESLQLKLQTIITNEEGEQRKIELQQPFGLVFKKE